MLTRFQPHKRDYSLKLGNPSLPARQKRSIYILAPRNLGLCSWLLNPAQFLHLKGTGDSVSTLDALCSWTHSHWLCFHETFQCQICASSPSWTSRYLTILSRKLAKMSSFQGAANTDFEHHEHHEHHSLYRSARQVDHLCTLRQIGRASCRERV